MRIVVLGAVIILIFIGSYFGWKAWNGSSEITSEQAGAVSGPVEAQEITIGTGDVAEPGKQVSILYEGRLESGTVFDSSTAHNNQPLVFVLGAQGIIPGFQIGVNGMREGGERTFTIPSSLGYGATDVKDASGNVVIPANSTLVFSVKLVEVSDAPQE